MSTISTLPVSRLAVCSLAIAVLGVHSPCAKAARWTFDPRIEATGIYDDNYRLTDQPGNEIQVWGGAIDALLAIGAQDQRTKFAVTPRVRSTFFSGKSDQNTNDQFLDLASEHQWLTARAGLDANYARQIVLRDYIPENLNTQLGSPDRGTDIGVLTFRTRQDFARVYPFAAFELAPRHRLELNAEYLDVKYEHQIANTREDYKNALGQAAYAVDISQTSTVSFAGLASKYEPDFGPTSNTYGLRLQWTKRQTANRQFYISGGADRTNFNQTATTTDNTTTSFSGGVGVNWQLQRGNVYVDLMRNIDPNGVGTVVARDELRLRLEHRFQQRLAGFIGLRGIQDRGVGSSTTFTGERYFAGSIGTEWRILRQFSFITTYDYTQHKYDTADRSARSNAVRLSFVYEPHRPENGPAITVGY